MVFVMNKAKYDSLPDDLKKVIDANSGAALSADIGRKWDEWDEIGHAAIVKRGTPIHVIDGADLAAWKKAVEPIYRTGSQNATRPATTAPSWSRRRRTWWRSTPSE